MFERLVPACILNALVAFATAAVCVALSPREPHLWSAAVALAALGGAVMMITAINIRIVPVFARRRWQNARLIRAQVATGIIGAWTIWMARVERWDQVETMGHLIALASGLLMIGNLRLLFKQQPNGARMPLPSPEQGEMDGLGILLSRFAGIMLLVGLGIGVYESLDLAERGRWDLAWAHALLVGYVLSMITSVCYHVLSRWTGRWWSGTAVKIARIQVWATVFAVPLMVIALAFDVDWLFMLAGPLEATALLIFLALIIPFAQRLPMSSRIAISMATVCLVVGVLMGAWFAGHPVFGPQFRMAHATLNLFGWLGLMISGVAYYLLPRMFGRPLRWPDLAIVQVAVYFTSVVLAATGWAMRIRWQGPEWPILLGGLGIAIGFGLLAANLAMTLATRIAPKTTVSTISITPRPR